MMLAVAAVTLLGHIGNAPIVADVKSFKTDAVAIAGPTSEGHLIAVIGQRLVKCSFDGKQISESTLPEGWHLIGINRKGAPVLQAGRLDLEPRAPQDQHVTTLVAEKVRVRAGVLAEDAPAVGRANITFAFPGETRWTCQSDFGNELWDVTLDAKQIVLASTSRSIEVRDSKTGKLLRRVKPATANGKECYITNLDLRCIASDRVVLFLADSSFTQELTDLPDLRFYKSAPPGGIPMLKDLVLAECSLSSGLAKPLARVDEQPYPPMWFRRDTLVVSKDAKRVAILRTNFGRVYVLRLTTK